MLGLTLNENSFEFNGENYLQTHGTAMRTKMAISFGNVSMAKIDQKNEDDVLMISSLPETVI